jgi:RNA polymerase sigma-70 factor (ECF subfamily)
MTNEQLGQSEWVRAAVERYQDALIRYAWLQTGNIEIARDVVQDTFTRLCAEEPQHLNSHLAQWLFTVCRNRALDVQKKNGLRKPPIGDAAILRIDPAADPAKRAEQREDAADALSLVSQLPMNQQEVLRLKFQNGFSYKEISQIIGLSVGNVGFLIHSAIKTVRQRMGADYGK